MFFSSQPVIHSQISKSPVTGRFQKSSTRHFVAICKKEILSTRLIMQVKPGADFLTDSRSATNDQSREWKRKEALLLRQFTSVPLRVEWLLQEDNCAWRKSNSTNTKNYICKQPSSLQIGGGDENWQAAGGKAGSVITRGSLHTW